MKELYLVEVVRFGNPDLGVHVFGVFDDFEKIAATMAEYNAYRGGKYPEYYITNIGVVNPTDTEFNRRHGYKVEY